MQIRAGIARAREVLHDVKARMQRGSGAAPEPENPADVEQPRKPPFFDSKSSRRGLFRRAAQADAAVSVAGAGGTAVDLVAHASEAKRKYLEELDQWIADAGPDKKEEREFVVERIKEQMDPYPSENYPHYLDHLNLAFRHDSADIRLTEMPPLPRWLSSVDVSNNAISVLSVPGRITRMVARYNQLVQVSGPGRDLSHLDVSGNPNLTTLLGLEGELRFLNIGSTGIPTLEPLHPKLARFGELDVTHCPKLDMKSLPNPNDTSLNRRKLRTTAREELPQEYLIAEKEGSLRILDKPICPPPK